MQLTWRDFLLFGTAAFVAYTWWRGQRAEVPAKKQALAALKVASKDPTKKPKDIAVARVLLGSGAVAEAGKEAIRGGQTYASDTTPVQKVG